MSALNTHGSVTAGTAEIIASVIVLNWNGERFLDACLRSLREQTLPGIETILVDNGSTDGSLALVADHFPDVKVIALDKNLGFSSGNNVGIQHARGRYIALLNNDAGAEPHWIEELVSALDHHPEISFCASRMVLYDRPELADSCGDYYAVDGMPGKIGHLEPAAGYSEPVEVFGACAGAAIYRRSLLEELGGFDEDFFLVYEDSDLSFRARLKGYKCLYVPAAVVRHHVSASLGERSDAAVYYAQRNLEYVFFKNMPTRLLVKYLPLHLLTNGFRFLAYMARRQTRCLLEAKIDAFRNLPRVLEKRRTIQRGRRASPQEIEALLARRPLSRMLRQKLHTGARTQPYRGANR